MGTSTLEGKGFLSFHNVLSVAFHSLSESVAFCSLCEVFIALSVRFSCLSPWGETLEVLRWTRFWFSVV